MQRKQSRRCFISLGHRSRTSPSTGLGDCQVFTPSFHAEGGAIMTKKSPLSRHSPQETWTHDRLCHEHAVAIACAIPSSLSSCSSAVTSYFAFCSAHLFPVEPTPDTLSFYTVYMAHYIKPKSISSYLSGVCSQLEPFFPDVCLHRHHWLISKTLKGCHKMFPLATSQKALLLTQNLPMSLISIHHHCPIITVYSSSSSLSDFTVCYG